MSRSQESTWTNLPVEVLMNIFNGLKMEGELGQPEYDTAWKSILTTRLVHPHWKLVIDELLEKWCLEYWTIWKADRPASILNPYGFPRLTFRNNWEDPIGIFCPPFLQEGNFEISPSPTKSVCITNRIGSHLLRRVNDFSKYGEHLTSLTFHQNLESTSIHLKTLTKVLRDTPNLKALSLQYVHISTDNDLEQPSLPQLAHLEHVKLWSIEQYCPSSKFNFVEWLLKPYKKQLLTLETDHSFEWNPNDGLLAYQNLKRLKVWNPMIRLLKADVAFPSLQCLSLGELRVGDSGPNTLQLVQKFSAHFSSTLVDLHLDISPFIYSHPRTYANRYDVEEGDVAFGPPIVNHTYPLMKTFWIFYPTTQEEVEVVKDFLKMFPNLETLKLLLGGLEIDEETARNHLIEQEYWSICQRLISITVQKGGREVSPLVRMQAPFS